MSWTEHAGRRFPAPVRQWVAVQGASNRLLSLSQPGELVHFETRTHRAHMCTPRGRRGGRRPPTEGLADATLRAERRMILVHYLIGPGSVLGGRVAPGRLQVFACAAAGPKPLVRCDRSYLGRSDGPLRDLIPVG